MLRNLQSIFVVLTFAAFGFGQEDIPTTAKATVGMSQPITIKLPAKTATFSTVINPPEGVTVWREHDPDPLLIKLRVELQTKSGKPLAAKYYLVIAIDGKISTCVITVDDAGDQEEPASTPTDELTKQVKILTDVVTKLDQRVASLEKTPIVTPKAAYLTFVVTAPNPKTAAVTEDAMFREYLNTNKITIYGITTKEQLAANSKFAGIASPAIVLMDASGSVIAAAPITDISSAMKLVQQFTGR